MDPDPRLGRARNGATAPLVATPRPELFFPIGTTGGALDQIDAAKRVCGQCPVTHECLEFALGTNQESGVWGGLTEEERRRLRKGAEATAQVG